MTELLANHTTCLDKSDSKPLLFSHIKTMETRSLC